jgi:hypothetical protein
VFDVKVRGVVGYFMESVMATKFGVRNRIIAEAVANYVEDQRLKAVKLGIEGKLSDEQREETLGLMKREGRKLFGEGGGASLR